MEKRRFNALLMSVVGIAIFIIAFYLFYSKIGMGSAQLENDPAIVMRLAFDSNFTPNTNISYDSSGKDNHVYARGNARWTENGRIGGGAFFSSISDNDYLAGPTSLIPHNTDFTIMAWVKRENIGVNGGIFAFANTSNIFTRFMFDDRNRLSFRIKNASDSPYTISSLGTVTDLGWHHVTAVREGRAMRIYIDGAKDSSSNENLFVGIMPDSAYYFRIGREYYNGNGLNGTIDDFRVYTRALSNAEISAIYSGTAPPQAVCGNGVKEGSEECDGGDFGGQSCISRGFSSGGLGCYAAGNAQGCKFDTTGCVSGAGSAIYVDGSVASSGDGSQGAPFKTIQEALDVVEPGKTIMIQAGVYNEAIDFKISGSSGSEISLERKQPGEEVIIQTSETIRFDQDYWIISGITFDHLNAATDFIIWTGDNIRLINSEVRNGQRDGITITQSLNSLLEYNVVHDFMWATGDAHCIVTEPSGSVPIRDLFLIKNNIYDCSGDGIQMYADSCGASSSSYSKNILIEGNLFYNNDDANAIRTENAIDLKEGDDIIIRKNEIRNFPNNKAIVAQKRHDNITVEENVIHDSRDGIEFRNEIGEAITNINVWRNIFYNVGYAIKFDGVRNAKVYHNTIDKVSSDSFRIEEGDESKCATGGDCDASCDELDIGLDEGEIRNNLVQSSGDPSIAGMVNVQYSNNGWFNSFSVGLSGAGDVVGSDAGFEIGGYRLTDSSEAIDKGVDLGLVLFSGSAPDLGAYEYTESLKCVDLGGEICDGGCTQPPLPASDVSGGILCCPLGSCIPRVGESCTDGIKNQDEGDVDCGGICINEGKRCVGGNACGNDGDCLSSKCINNKCAYFYRVCANNAAGMSCSSNAVWGEIPVSCSLTAAYWNQANAVDGDSVELIVEGTNCDNEQVGFEIWEDDFFGGDDLPVTQPTGNFAFVNWRAVARWSAEYQTDGLFGGNPEYYFKATVVGRQISMDSTNIIRVSASACTTCAPEINVPSLGSIALVPGSAKELAFEFNVKGDTASINDNTAIVKFSKGTVERASSGCSLASSEAGRKKFTCAVTMQYYDEAGEWNIDISVNDNTGNTIRNNTEKFIVEELRDISLNSRSVNFQSIKSGATNVIADPVTISNNGNYGSSIKITAHNLYGSRNSNEFIDASLFRIGTSADACNSGVSAVNGTEVTVAGSSLPVGASSSEELYYCLSSVGGISSQEYATLPGFGWKIGLA